jgi:hypothetical protein
MNRTSLRLAATAALAAVLAAPARAAVSASVSEATGNNDYQSVYGKASVDIGDAWTLSPNYTRYRTDFTNGTYNDYGLRIGYESGPLALGVSGALLPVVNGYSQGDVGGDLTFTLRPGGSPHGRKMAGPDSDNNAPTYGAGLTAIDLGVSVNEITHRDDLMTTPGSGPFGPTTARKTPLELGQTDLAAFGGLRFLFTELSAQVTKSEYDHRSLDSLNLRGAPYLSLVGVTGIEQGYPDLSWNARLKWKLMPIVKPYITYTHTTYQLGENSSNAFQVGGTAGFDMLNVSAGYEHFSQVGTPSRDYITLGAGLNFGS